MATTSTFSAETYFNTQAAPASLEQDVKAAREFIAKHARDGRRIVLVTSGGTTVPLELNVVRFLDNFSAGTRGATSAEYFLQAGYAVIFMHRQFSLQPFSRHYSHSTNPFLDFLEVEDDDEEPPNPFASPPLTRSPSAISPLTPDGPARGLSPHITVAKTQAPRLLPILRAYKKVHKAGTLHTMTFVTVNEYLWLLRSVSKAISEEMREHGNPLHGPSYARKALFYLAAAVSDFFLPTQKMSEHKIQSGKGSLIIEMDQVPKILKPMVDEWTPEAFVVSFKLETDPAILVPKARTALERYGHQVVIGNELHRRKYEVVFVSRDTPQQTPDSTSPVDVATTISKLVVDAAPDSQPQITETWLRVDEDAVNHHGKEIEEEIVRELVRKHNMWVQNGTSRNGNAQK